MKIIKFITVLIFSAALFFSCAQENIGDYGTLIINPSGSSSERVTAIVDNEVKDFEKGLTYTFECINTKTDTKIVTDPYKVGKSHDVIIQLSSGDWVVWVKVLRYGREIGSSKYNNGKPVTIKAGQTIILGGIGVQTDEYGKAVARKVEEDFNITEANFSKWDNSPTIYIDRFVRLNSDGSVMQPTVHITPNGPHGTAKILWSENALYVLVLVKDANLSLNNSDEHNSNSVEIFFNENGTGHQYRIDSDGSKTYSYSRGSGDYHKNQSFPDAVELSIIKGNLPTGVSYAVIAKIPFTKKRNSGDIIGIDLQINGAPPNGSTIRSSVAVWFDNKAIAYEHPEFYKETLALVD